MRIRYLICFLGVLFIGCKQETEQLPIVNAEDYNSYLDTSIRPTFSELQAEKEFWSNRLDADTTGIGDIGPLAAAYEGLFEQTGNIHYLKDAEHLYRKGRSLAAAQYQDAFDRGLTHNLISQHRFQEAYQIILQSYGGVSAKRPTELLLFDVAMELGRYDEAYERLSDFQDLTDYNYLIRVAKWSDHIGDLEHAIQYMEMAKEKAEARDSKPLKIWTYSNLADYYGHAGRIADSYVHYLKTLELQPDNDYVKKGIAWIAYSWEENPIEAHRILDSVMKVNKSPDYYLLKSELFTFQNDSVRAQEAWKHFESLVTQPMYGGMYNTYLIEGWAESNPSKALALAREEVSNRPTPETYHWLAYAQLKADKAKEALQAIEEHVVGKTHEPMAQYHAAMVYKANSDMESMAKFKSHVMEAQYELGPVLMRSVNEL